MKKKEEKVEKHDSNENAINHHFSIHRTLNPLSLWLRLPFCSFLRDGIINTLAAALDYIWVVNELNYIESSIARIRRMEMRQRKI